MTTLIQKNNNSPIGFFDSGVGGLTVLNSVKKLLPNENFIFFGDSAHVPYGEKTKEELLSYARDILEFFAKNECKAVVMACNTTSSVIYDDIKDWYDFRLYPIVQSVAKILASDNVNSLGVFATKATVNSHSYEREINRYNPNIRVFSQFCPQWVNIVEKNLIDSSYSIEIIKNDLFKMLENNPDKIVLGCTHYPYLTEVISKFYNKDLIIDPSVYFSEYIAKDLEQNGLLNTSNSKGYEKYFVSANPEQFKTSAKMFCELEKAPELLPF